MNMNDQMVYVEIIEAAYKDNWNEGEIDDTFQINVLEKGLFESAKAAVERFKNTYSGLAYGDSKLQVEGDFIALEYMAKVANDYYGWATPSNEELEDWKAGKIDLWSVEIQLHIHKIQRLEEEELKKLL